MIITKLQGGLGNQMFQYAYGRALSLRRDTSLKIDITKYETGQEWRPYQLENFSISATKATSADFKAIGVPASNTTSFFSRVQRKTVRMWDELKPIPKRKVIMETPNAPFNPQLLEVKNNVLLIGN